MTYTNLLPVLQLVLVHYWFIVVVLFREIPCNVATARTA